MFRNHCMRVIVALVLILTLLCGAALAETVRVAIVQPLTHTSLNQIRDTIVSRLEASDVEFEIITKNAEGDSAALSTILENVKNCVNNLCFFIILVKIKTFNKTLKICYFFCYCHHYYSSVKYSLT